MFVMCLVCQYLCIKSQDSCKVHVVKYWDPENTLVSCFVKLIWVRDKHIFLMFARLISHQFFSNFRYSEKLLLASNWNYINEPAKLNTNFCLLILFSNVCFHKLIDCWLLNVQWQIFQVCSGRYFHNSYLAI